MMRSRVSWLAAAGLSLLVGGCDYIERLVHDKFMVCPAPAGVVEDERMVCHYVLTVIGKDPSNPNLWRVRVADSVIKRNAERYGIKDEDLKQYINHQYAVTIVIPEKVELMSNTDYHFESVYKEAKIVFKGAQDKLN